MTYRLALPDLGEGVAEGQILRWLVAVGDEITEDDPLVEVETDKSGVDIPSPVAGRVSALHGAPGDVVDVGTVLLEIEVAEAPGAPPEVAETPARRVAATPRVRQLARELGVDLDAMTGSGPAGRITEDDVRGAAATSAPPGLRRTIARRLTEAAVVPTVTNVDDCAFDAVRAAGVPPLLAVARACVVALGEHPALNAWAVDGELQMQPAVHLGVATQSERGLVVPVVRDAARLDLEAVGTAIAGVTTAAREGRSGPGELRGSTFTITSAGRQSGLWSTPLLNLPEVAILGLYRVEPRPVVRDGAVVVAEMANLSITFDHRVMDGLDAAAFLGRVTALVEHWPAGA